MTKAMNKALDIYPAPPEWVPAQGIQTKLSADDIIAATRLVMLRESLNSDDWPRKVRAFRTVMRLDLPTEPTPLPPMEKTLHAALIASELNEFSEAGDVIEQADGLLDIIYVALGALKHLGLSDGQILAGFGEVHASNMTKVQDDGTPLINDGLLASSEPIGKALKTHNYVRPDLALAMGIEP